MLNDAHMENPPVFFGGDAANMGRVHRLAPASFRELVDQVLNLAVPLNVTREEYAAMPDDAQKRAKRVPYIVPCTFAESPSQRLVEKAVDIVLLCLDIDVDKKTGACPARPYYASPETLAEQLMPFNFAMYSTASSTHAAPRLRIMVEAGHLPVERYRDAVNDIARRIGLVQVTHESYTVHQPMYLPTLFKGDTHHPLLISDVTGRAYQLRDIGDTDAPELPPPPNGRPSPAVESDGFDALEYLRPTVENITLQDARAALKFIDPDVSYPEWLEMAAALRHQFPLEEEDAAYELFDEWSATGTKYVSKEDTRAKWDSLRPNPRNRVPVTIRTLLQRAATAGWDSGQVKARCYKATRQWIIEHADEDGIQVLLTEGLRQIAATPLLTASEEEALLQEIGAVARKVKMKIGLASLRRDLRRMKVAATAVKASKARTPDWAKGMCYVSRLNEFLRPSIYEQLSPEALDSVYGNQLLPTEDELKEGGDSSICARGKPTIRPRDFLLNIVNIPRAYDVIYDPRQFNDTFIVQEGKTFVNTYTRTHPEPDLLRMDEAGELFLRHLHNLIAEDDYARILLDFLAYLVQHPGAKVRWAVLLQGAQGCGKTFLAEAMKAVLGRGHVAPIDNEAIRGQWNDWAYGHQLVVVEEVRVAGQNRHEIMNRLKPLISNDMICINQRFRDSRNVENSANYVLFTNHHDALALSSGDRRYFVLKSKLQTRQQVHALGPHYFEGLFAMLRDNAAGLRAWFEHYEISKDFCPDGHAPETVYLQQLVADTASDVQAALRETIEDSLHPLVRPDLVSSTILRQLIQEAGTPCAPQQLARVLRDEGWARAGRFPLDDEARHYLWVRADGTLQVTDAARVANQRLEEAAKNGTGEELL